VFGRLKEYNLKLHLSKCRFFHTQVECLGQMIFPSGLGVQKAKVETISQIFQPTNGSWFELFWAYVITIKGL
jgi:hypothetical protein